MSAAGYVIAALVALKVVVALAFLARSPRD
jgi:hypothetical protein